MAETRNRRAGEHWRREQVPRPWPILIAFVLPLIACSRGTRPPCDNPPPIYITLQAADRLNPDDQGRSLPTQVQVLQLKSITRFESAGFDDIWRNRKEVVGEDLVQMDEKFLDPGGSDAFGVMRDPRANYMAVVGLFRKPSGTSWRSISRLSLPPPDKCTPQPAEVKKTPSRDDTQLKFFLQEYRIEDRTPPEKASAPTRGAGGGKT